MYALVPIHGNLQLAVSEYEKKLKAMAAFNQENLSSLTFPECCEDTKPHLYLLVRYSYINALFESLLVLLQHRKQSNCTVVFSLASTCRSICELAGEVKWVFGDKQSRQTKLDVFSDYWNKGLTIECFGELPGAWIKSRQLSKGMQTSYTRLAEGLFVGNGDGEIDNFYKELMPYSALSGMGHGDPDKIAPFIKFESSSFEFNVELAESQTLAVMIFTSIAYSVVTETVIDLFNLVDLKDKWHTVVTEKLN